MDYLSNYRRVGSKIIHILKVSIGIYSETLNRKLKFKMWGKIFWFFSNFLVVLSLFHLM